MLFRSKLVNLDNHINFLNKKIKNLPAGKQGQDIFLVGGAIRNLLLGIDNDPTDIDFTMAGKPEEIYKKIDKKWLSHFITEKFGTITLIKKLQGGKVTKIQSEEKNYETLKYELTPLRTEWDYEDFRHPGKINRSNDLLLDSARREFTISAIYYANIKSQAVKTIKISSIQNVINDEELIEILEKKWFVWIENLNLFVIQSHEYINKLFKDGEIQIDYIKYLFNLIDTNAIRLWKIKIKSDWIMRFVIDPHKWIQDLNDKKLRTVGDPDKRFGEDALRIIRALRIVNVGNVKLLKQKSEKLFDFEKDTRMGIKKNCNLLEKVAKERIKEEICKAFKEWSPFWFISLLDETKLLEFLFPALYQTKKIEQPIRYHPFDIYAHTLLSLFELEKINPDYLVRFAMLYHDVGKVDQFWAYKDNLNKDEIREILAWPLNHRRSWPELVKRDFSKLGFSSKEINDISRYVENHHKPEEILFAKEENKIKKTRKFFSEAWWERANNILDIMMADRTGTYNPLQKASDLTEVIQVKRDIKKLNEKEGQFTAKKLAINGDDIMKHFKLKPWKNIGYLLEKALDRAMSDIKKRNDKKTILWYLGKFVK